jgi:peptidoglycan hydrolase-like protein with peptidoglycan-binding domain
MAAPSWKPTPVKGNRPGSRELKRGDKGADVVTVQLFLGLEPSGTWDAATQKAMIGYQRSHKLADSGRADREFWGAVIPRIIRWRRMGEAGTEIRLVQSALAAFGYMDPRAVTGRYGMVTNRAVYGFRTSMGLRGSTKVDLPMWESLFDLQYQAERRSLITT